MKRITFSRERLRTTSMYASRACQGRSKSLLASVSYSGATVSRNQSKACRSGALHCWFQPEWPPELQPQSLFQRSTPCAQLQEVLPTILASWVGGCFSRYSAYLVSRASWLDSI